MRCRCGRRASLRGVERATPRTLEILRGLGQHYNAHPALPAYLEAAITYYVDALEIAAIVRLLEEDERRADHGAGR